MSVGPEDFFKRLEESGLLNDSIVEQKDRLQAATSVEEAAADLVSRKLLTAYQSEVLLSGEDVPLAVGDYVVTDSIGRGGMGYVLKARHRRMKRQVAIKFLLKSLTDSDDLRRRFEREVEAAAQLDHQNIVTAYDAGVHEGSHYLVMQYVDGEDLSHLVKSTGPLDIPDAVDVIRQAALGLGYAHDRGIIHRDIKPGNLLLDNEGVVRILDMGLARMTPSPGDELEGGANADLTNTGSVMGTIDYMAPEQALDAKSVDHRADLYALGCTLYFLLTSNPPFRNETVMRRLLAHREQPAPKISAYRPDAPRELDDIFATMMAKSPDDRFPSMKHLVVALDSLELGDSEAEQMATLDVPDDGNGGFVGLPGYDASANSESATLPPTSTQSGEGPLPGGAHSLPVPDVTILETPSNVSALTALDDAEAVSQAGTSDTDFTGVSETIIGDTHSVAGEVAAREAKSQPPWKLIAPLGLAVVAVIAFLVTRPAPTTEKLEPAKQTAESDMSPDGDILRSKPPSNDSLEPDNSAIPPSDRRAAEAVWKLGGTVSVRVDSGELQSIKTPEELPVTRFRVTEINLASRPELNDQVMSDLQGLSDLEALYLQETSITDRGLANLTDEGRQPLAALKRVYLSGTDVSEAGLQYLAGSGDLEGLLLHDTQVSRAKVLTRFPNLNMLAIAGGPLEAGSMSVVKSLPNLARLEIDGRQLSNDVTDDVARLKKLRQLVLSSVSADFDGRALAKLTELSSLGFYSADPARFDESFWGEIKSLSQLENLYFIQRMTDQALGRMQTMPQLSAFGVTSKEVSGAGLAKALAKMPNVTDLQIRYLEWDDEDIKHVHDFQSLRKIELDGNYITAEGVNLLRSNLPACRIISDHGTFEPGVAVMNPDRRAAEAALKLGGAVWVGNDFQQIVESADLPEEPFVVTKIDLSEKKNIEDEFLANFRGLADLQILILTETSITDRGLANLTDEGQQPLPALQRLHLDGTGISQTGLQFLSGSHDLIGLLLDNTATTDGAVLDQFPKLAMLGLGYTEFTADELQLLVVRFPQLNYLTMDGRHMSETMANALANVPELRVLKLRDLPSDFDPGRLARLPLLTELYLEADDSTVYDDDFWKVIAGLEKLHILMCKGVTDESLAKAPPITQVEVFIVMSKVVTGEAVAKSMSKFPNVLSLTVNYADWTDNDVQQLHSLKSLGKLDLTKNSASAESIKALSVALPKCLIISDHGTIEPTKTE